jgi:hypothetical protein
MIIIAAALNPRLRPIRNAHAKRHQATQKRSKRTSALPHGGAPMIVTSPAR